jgi:hypothetical protein
LNIFEKVKAQVSTRKVAEYYGLKVNQNGMACCPFHNDKHPSMKIDDNHYHCFGCGAHGDAIGYVAQLYGLGQYEAAKKLIEDFGLMVESQERVSAHKDKLEIHGRNSGILLGNQNRKMSDETKNVQTIKANFEKWRRETIADLKECEDMIETSKQALVGANPHTVFISNGFAYMMHAQPIIGYWLDILCLEGDEEAREFLRVNGKEVHRIVANVRRAADEILGRNGRAVG